MKKKKSAFNVKFNEAQEQLKSLAAQTKVPVEPEHQSTLEPSNQNIRASKHQNTKAKVMEKATDRTTVSFTPFHTEKLARMAIDYKKHTGKKIVANEIIRRLVEKSTLEDILV